MHNKTQKDDETCIDCHKGTTHFPSEIKMDGNTAHELESQAVTSVTNGTHVYSFKISRIGDLVTMTLDTSLTVVDISGEQPIAWLQGYQMQGNENTFYLAAGRRLALAILSEEDIKMLAVNGEWQADEYGNQWHQVSLQGSLTDPVLADNRPLQQYVEKLDDTYCAGCYAPTAAGHHIVNARPSIVREVGARTSMSKNELDILTQYFQYNTKDITEKQ